MPETGNEMGLPTDETGSRTEGEIPDIVMQKKKEKNERVKELRGPEHSANVATRPRENFIRKMALGTIQKKTTEREQKSLEKGTRTSVKKCNKVVRVEEQLDREKGKKKNSHASLQALKKSPQAKGNLAAGDLHPTPKTGTPPPKKGQDQIRPLNETNGRGYKLSTNVQCAPAKNQGRENATKPAQNGLGGGSRIPKTRRGSSRVPEPGPLLEMGPILTREG